VGTGIDIATKAALGLVAGAIGGAIGVGINVFIWGLRDPEWQIFDAATRVFHAKANVPAARKVGGIVGLVVGGFTGGFSTLIAGLIVTGAIAIVLGRPGGRANPNVLDTRHPWRGSCRDVRCSVGR